MDSRTSFCFVCLFNVLLIAVPTPSHAEAPKGFCEKNPEARICQSVHDEREQERQDLEEQCRIRPNTEKCKNKRTMESVKNERLAYCEKNPKACAAKRRPLNR